MITEHLFSAWHSQCKVALFTARTAYVEENLMRRRHPTLSFASTGIFILLLVFALVGCAPGTVTLTYWYTEGPAETPVILQLIQKFQHDNPNIKIDAQHKSFFEIETAFAIAAQTGNAPDVLRSDVSWIAQFASQGYLLPIKSDLSDYQSVQWSYGGPLSYV